MYRLRVSKATRRHPAGSFTTCKSQKCVETHSAGVQVTRLDVAIDRERERERERACERLRLPGQNRCQPVIWVLEPVRSLSTGT